MSQKTNGVNHSMRVPVKGRRHRALERLEAQLAKGTKESKNKDIEATALTVPLTDTDIKRINKEIAILKKRI